MEIFQTVSRTDPKTVNTNVFWSEISARKMVAEIITNLSCISESLQLLMATSIGERFFNPTFGNTVATKLFDLITDDNVASLKDGIVRSIEKWEPRVAVDINNTTISVSPDSQVISIKLSFNIVGDDSYTNYSYTLNI